MKANTLDTILARTALTVAQSKAAADLPEMERRAADHQPRGFAAALRRTAKHGPAVIAELKRASPSRGVIREDFQPVTLARSLAESGAAALSVLTDEPFFQGSLNFLQEVSKAVSIPVLRKDFMIDPFQMLEARAAGADAILLIVAALSDADLQILAKEARRLELDILCEVHDESEVSRAIDSGADAIGVNSRNLKTLAVDPRIHETLVNRLPLNVIRVAESGLLTVLDVERALDFGYNAFLIGETLMRQPDPGAALVEMMGVRFATEP